MAGIRIHPGLIASVALAALTLGCHSGGEGIAIVPGTNGRTVLVFSDDCGNPLNTSGLFSGLVIGSRSQDSFLLRPVRQSDGSLALTLLPGSYTVHAQYQRDATSAPITIDQPFTVSNVRGEFINISLSDPRLDVGWAKYRQRDFEGAKIVFENLQSEGVTQGAVENGLGWTNGQLGLIGDASANFNAAQGEGCTGTDALVGYSGLLLLNLNTSDSSRAEGFLTDAISRGNYHSAPVHDNISKTDLYVSRALARYLKGDTAGAQADLELARPTIGDDPNFAGIDLFNMLDLQLKN